MENKNNNINTNNFEDRITIRDIGENQFKEWCNTVGFDYMETGYEHTYSPEEVAVLRTQDNAESLYIRHFPDFHISGGTSSGYYVDVKTALKAGDYKDVTIEEASWNVLLQVDKATDYQAILVYSYGDEKLYGNYVNNIYPKYPYKQNKSGGSNTPFLFIPKNQMVEINDLFSSDIYPYTTTSSGVY